MFPSAISMCFELYEILISILKAMNRPFWRYKRIFCDIKNLVRKTKRVRPFFLFHPLVLKFLVCYKIVYNVDSLKFYFWTENFIEENIPNFVKILSYRKHIQK